MIIDVNVNLSRWPFRRLPCDELPKLVERLRAAGVSKTGQVLLQCPPGASLVPRTDKLAERRSLPGSCQEEVCPQPAADEAERLDSCLLCSQ